MWIKNVFFYNENHAFAPGAVEVDGERIKSVLEFSSIEESKSFAPDGNGGELKDGEGCYLLPGFTDIHFHGCMGCDLGDGTQEALRTIATFEASQGVTQICPATMTLPKDELVSALKNAAAFRDAQRQGPHSGEADFLGVNMEGPFISYAKKGAQNEKYIVPRSVEVFREYQEAADGLVKFIAIAPEMPPREGEAGSVEGDEVEAFIAGVGDSAVVSIAHSAASYEEARKALEAGASHGVHLYNAMTGLDHRAPGIVGAIFDDEKATAEMICDGVHVHPAAIRATFKALGAGRIIMISDSMRAAGLPDGVYELGGQQVRVEGNLATLIPGGGIAASVTLLSDCVRFVVKVAGIPLETAVACAAENPAKRIGVFEDYGSIREGKVASLLLWDKDLRSKGVLLRGSWL